MTSPARRIRQPASRRARTGATRAPRPVLAERSPAALGELFALLAQAAGHGATRLRIGAQDLGGNWAEAARFDDAHALQLVDRLLADARNAAIGFDLGAREVRGLSLLVEEGGTSPEGWKIPEVEVWVP